VDVGAAGGVEELWLKLANEKLADCYGFEPFEENFLRLQPSEQIQYFPIAISDRTTKLPFFGRTTVGSLEGPPIDHADYETTIVQADTLDRLVETNLLPEIDSLKIDVEGHELSVLKGAQSALTKDVLYLKVEFSFYNSFTKIYDALAPLGFCLFSFATNSSLAGNLSGGDVLFVREADSILANHRLTDKQKLIMMLKLIAISAATNLFAYSYYCLRRLSEARICDASLTDELLSHFHEFSYLPALIPKSRVRKLLAAILFSGTTLFSGFMTEKSTPKPNRLVPSRRLWIKNHYLPLAKASAPRYWNKVYESARDSLARNHKREPM